MAFDAPLVSSSIGDIGTAVGDLFSSKGFSAEASTYGSAAQLEDQNISIEKSSVAIQQAQAQRQLYQSFSGTKADVAGAGLAEGGSAGDILRSSAQQGALTHALVGEQGQIQENAYAAQAGAYRGQQSSASASSKASGIGGALSSLEGVAGLAMMFL